MSKSESDIVEVDDSGSFVSGFIACVIGVLLCAGGGYLVFFVADDFVSLDYADVDTGPVYEPIGLVSGESNYWLILVPLVVGSVCMLVLLFLPSKHDEEDG